MQFDITKNEGKPHVISYTRDNGTVTWMHSDDYFVRHDLSHYAIESTMPYRTAFNGMINNGMDIKDFENREKRALIPITAEAAYAENMANLFLQEIWQGEFDDFNKIQQGTFATSVNGRFPLTTLPQEKIDAVRCRLRELLQRWDELPAGETLTLTFPS